MIQKLDPPEVPAPPPAPAGAPGGEPPPFRPQLPAFSGPLDLLLYLIQKNEIDIFDIPIVEILTQYLTHVELLERNGVLDLAQAGEFLVMASRLMEIKSRMMLPDLAAAEDDGMLEEELEDPRGSLVEQLLEYRAIKERAVMLERVHEEWAARYHRPSLELPSPPDTLDLGRTTVWDLCAAFERLLAETRGEPVKVITIDDTPIEVIIRGMQQQLESSPGGALPFGTLFRAEMGRARLISHFLALLEMCRLHLVWVTQEREFGEILITLRVIP